MTHREAIERLKGMVEQAQGCPMNCDCHSTEECALGALLETAPQALKDIDELAAGKQIILGAIFRRLQGDQP